MTRLIPMLFEVKVKRAVLHLQGVLKGLVVTEVVQTHTATLVAVICQGFLRGLVI